VLRSRKAEKTAVAQEQQIRKLNDAIGLRISMTKLCHGRVGIFFGAKRFFG